MFGNKDTDGFYRAEIRDRVGLIPCNMVSEIQTEDGDMMAQLLNQGFLPLNTPVEKLGETSFFGLFCPLNLHFDVGTSGGVGMIRKCCHG